MGPISEIAARQSAKSFPGAREDGGAGGVAAELDLFRREGPGRGRQELLRDGAVDEELLGGIAGAGAGDLGVGEDRRCHGEVGCLVNSASLFENDSAASFSFAALERQVHARPATDNVPASGCSMPKSQIFGAFWRRPPTLLASSSVVRWKSVASIFVRVTFFRW